MVSEVNERRKKICRPNMYLIVLLILSFGFSKVNGLMCYKCNSLYNNDCVEVRDKGFSYHYDYCNDKSGNETITEYKKPLCRKIKQKIKVRNNMEVIKRSCGWVLYKNIDEDTCYENRNEDYEEIVCQCFTDGCNGSMIKIANSVLTFVLAGLTFFCFPRR